MDTNLVRSFCNIAKHYLSLNVKIIIEQHPHNFVSESIEKQVEKVQKQLLVTHRQQTLLSVTAIQKYCETCLKSIFPQLPNSHLMKIVKNCVKEVIRSIIQKELNSKQAQVSLKRQHFQFKQNSSQGLNIQKQSFIQNEPKNQFTKVNNQQKLKKGPLDYIKSQPSNVLQTQKDSLFENQKSNESKQKLQKRDSNVQTSIYGHFLYQDKPDEILDIFPVIDEIYVLISWKRREDDFLPQPSSLSVQTVRIFAPLLLAQYYQRFLAQQKHLHALQDIKQEQI